MQSLSYNLMSVRIHVFLKMQREWDPWMGLGKNWPITVARARQYKSGTVIWQQKHTFEVTTVSGSFKNTKFNVLFFPHLRDSLIKQLITVTNNRFQHNAKHNIYVFECDEQSKAWMVHLHLKK